MKHPTALEREFCIHLYSEGWLQKQLAFKFGRPIPTIRQWIKKAGAQRGHKFRGRAPSQFPHVSGAE